MVDTIGSGTIARLSRDSGVLRARIEDLSRQSSDGRRADYYGGLAPDARRSIDLRREVARRESHMQALDRTLGRTETAQTALSRLTEISREFMAEASQLTSRDGTQLRAVAESARNALREVGVLLNEQHAGEYLFNGTDTANPPVPDADSLADGPMASSIRARVATLAPGTAATIAADTAADVTDDTAGFTPFSTHLTSGPGVSEPRRSAAIDDRDSAAYGLFATRNAAATSTGETVGSWSRDLVRGLAMLSGLTTDSMEQGDDYVELIGTIRGALRSATDALGEEAGALGVQEARMEAAKTRHSDVIVALEKQRAAIEEVDLAETLTLLQDTRTRLEASYSALNLVSQLSLTNFVR